MNQLLGARKPILFASLFCSWAMVSGLKWVESILHSSMVPYHHSKKQKINLMKKISFQPVFTAPCSYAWFQAYGCFALNIVRLTTPSIVHWFSICHESVECPIRHGWHDFMSCICSVALEYPESQHQRLENLHLVSLHQHLRSRKQ